MFIDYEIRRSVSGNGIYLQTVFYSANPPGCPPRISPRNGRDINPWGIGCDEFNKRVTPPGPVQKLRGITMRDKVEKATKRLHAKVQKEYGKELDGSLAEVLSQEPGVS